jgi:hypothetical protein
MSFILDIENDFLALPDEIRTFPNNSSLNINIYLDEQSIIKIQLKIKKPLKKKHTFSATLVSNNIDSSLVPYIRIITYNTVGNKLKLTTQRETPYSFNGIINDYINPIYDGIKYSRINN